MKKHVALYGCAMFCVACLSLYLMLESTTLSPVRYVDFGENDLSSIESKIKQIEADLHKNHLTINLIKKTVRELADGNVTDWEKLRHALDVKLDDVDKQYAAAKGVFNVQPSFNMSAKDHIEISKDMCQFAQTVALKPDVQMMDLYSKEAFDNPNGGVWKQGFPITYDMKTYEDKPLKVFVVPHSHTDPGWIKTFDRYYTDQTRHIFNNMVEKLEQYPKMRFIYAEMSFFSKWWNEIDQSKRTRVKKLIAEKRLEIVTGGWVMTDEANAHYFSMLDQMIEGNQWLINQLGVKPESSWSIDPFGYSPTMAYLLKRMGFHNMLIQRTHYAVKKTLGKEKQLEFMWRQIWDHGGTTDMFCHMMPFYSYDVPHTCGPDPKVCCQFDFKRLPGGRVTCPWKVPPVAISSANVKDKAETLLDQYRKKAQLYRNNMVLIPLGDDFRYDKPIEWDQQYNNYQMMFDYLNSHPEYKVEARFGTLSEYFNALYERSQTSPGKRPADYPVLSGDFFSYADRDDHYWTGYFTSRPFYKKLDRVLEHHLRAGEIIFSLAVAHARHNKLTNFAMEQLMPKIVQARRNLGLYQHHDGITGTAKDFVVVDYGQRMLNAMMDMKRVIAASAHFLLTKNKKDYKFDELSVFELDEQRTTHDSLPERTVIKVTDQAKPVVFYNSKGHTRTEVKRIYVSFPHVEVKDSEGKVIPTQVDPYWLTNDATSDITFKISFVVTVPGFGLSRYEIRKVGPMDNLKNYFPQIDMYNVGTPGTQHKGPFEVNNKNVNSFKIENNELVATFSGKTGMLQNLHLKSSGHDMKTELEFLKYGTRAAREKSGAYLFLPDGAAHAIIYSNPAIRVIRGPVVSEVHVFIPHVEHVVRLHTSPGIDSLSVDISNLVDIRSESNKELVMRLQTGVQNNGREFYTDLNGFQITKRQYMTKLPLQANFYPMPTMAFLQDEKYRVNVLSGQSLGAASLEIGMLEIMQDRRLNQDDNRGLGQGVLDNKRTPNSFRILVEEHAAFQPRTPSQPAGFASLVAQMASQQLIHPIHVLPPRDSAANAQLMPNFIALSKPLPCEVHLVNLRSVQLPEADTQSKMPAETTSLILHRLAFDCSYPAVGLQCQVSDGKVTLSTMFNSLKAEDIQEMSLSLIHDQGNTQPDQVTQLQPMEINAYVMKFH